MNTRSIEDIYPLSPMQQGMLFHSLYAPESGIYMEQMSVLLQGDLHVAAFERAWQQVMARNPILRTGFLWEEAEQPLQIVHKQVPLALEQRDLCGLAPAEQDARLDAFLEEERRAGFDLAEPPLMRLTLFRLGESSYRLVWSHHHLLLDGWSMPLLLKEVFAFYEAFRLGRSIYLPPAKPYRNYIAWLQKQDAAAAESFWRQTLQGFSAPTPLVVADLAGRPGEPAGAAEEAVFPIAAHTLSPAASQALRGLAQQHGLTLNTLVQGAWAFLLSRYSRDEDIMFGATVSGRPPDLDGAESMLGLFINTLPVRVVVPAQAPLLPWLKELQARSVALRQFEYSPLVQIQEWSEVPRGQPLFHSLLVFENYPVDAAVNEGGGSLQLSGVRHVAKTNYPLTLIAAPGRELGFQVSYDSRRFDAATVRRLLGHLGCILESFPTHLDRPLSSLPLATSAEQRSLLEEWSRAEIPFGSEVISPASVVELFAGQVRRTPEAVAVIAAGGSGEPVTLTYAELDRSAERLAAHLRGLGVGPDVLVAISVERSAEMVIGVLGILKAGGAYLPIDPNYPAERRAFMLADSQAAVLLTQKCLVEDADVRKVVCMDEVLASPVELRSETAAGPSAPDDLAYVIYTSGSTGKPKGVMVTHRSLSNHAQAMAGIFALSPADRMLQFISLSFDASAEEIFPTLIRGAALVLPGASAEMTGSQLLRFCARHGVSILHLPAAFWHQCVDEMAAEKLPAPAALRLALVGGESPSLERLRSWAAMFARPVRFLNAYGPTEGTITSTLFEISATPAVVADLFRLPIGRPLPNVQVYLLDECGQPVPVGVAGELYVGGAGVARGYLNRPELTAERFVAVPGLAVPGLPNQRLYKTGDLARWLPDGNLQFLGRVDEQVKVRGFRVELGEIESVLRQAPEVREAVVTLRDDSANGDHRPGDRRLVAYLVPAEPGADLRPADLRQFLRARLPEYMLPGVFVTLDSLPLTPSGKVDRRRLPAPEGERPDLESSYVAPRSAVEEIVAGVWADVLGVERVGMQDNFFDLGGHSLLATRLVARLRQAFAVELPLRDLFESPTPAAMAAQVLAAQEEGAGLAAPPITPLPADAEIPLSFSQQRLWFLDQLEPGNLFYNISTAVRLLGRLDAAALEASLNEIVRRHASLRTSFATVNGQPVQVIAPQLALVMPHVDLRGLPAAEREAAARARITAEARQPFDLSRGPLLRGLLVQLGDEEHIALLVVHHVVSDGWSMNLLVRELATLYLAFSTGTEPQAARPSPLPPLPVQYADYAAWQRSWLQGETLEKQLAYWKEQLAGMPPVLDLPTDRPRPAIKTSNGAAVSFALSPELSAQVQELCRSQGVTLYMALLAAFQTLLYRYTGQTDISVGSAIANRSRSEVESLIGFFVNTLVLRNDLSGNPTFRELLERVRETALGAYAHQDLPFEMLVDALQPERNLSYTPLFQVGFDVQKGSLGSLELPGLRIEPVQVHSGTAAFDLLFSLTETSAGILGSLDYNTDLFDRPTVERLLEHFRNLLAAVVADPDQEIGMLPLMGEAELERILVEWNRTAWDTPMDRCAHELFEARAAAQPDAPALIFEGRQLTYAELDRRANQLAHSLQKLGVGPGVLVGISTERSFEMIVAILGTLKAGAAYLPLDPTYPPDRLAFMQEDSGIRVLLTTRGLSLRADPTPQRGLSSSKPEANPIEPESSKSEEGFRRRSENGAQPASWEGVSPSKPGLQVILLDSDWPTIALEPETKAASAITPAGLAYVIYTSGSTGRPKGAMLAHRGLSNLAEAQRLAFSIQPGCRVLQFSPFSFDASVWEIFMALANGAALVLARQETLTSGLDLVRLLRAERVTHVTLPPAVLRVISPDDLPELRTVIAAGEACTPDLVARWAPGRDFFNAYGPTETTVCASLYRCDPLDTQAPPIGRPLLNTRLYVLEAAPAEADAAVHEAPQPVPVGVPGELYVGGAGVALGYLNRPELTAERFVPDPYSEQPAARLYKTGDLVRYRADGNLEFLGRIDQQVKVRGFRIELGEIETVLGNHPGVRDAAVIAFQEGAGESRLVAYVALAGEPAADQAAADQFATDQPAASSHSPLNANERGYSTTLRTYLRGVLPEYMVPAQFVFLPALPLSPSGKVDRRRLPAPEAGRPELEREYVAPRSETEEKLAAMVADLLRVDRVGVFDNFFELGGHSLLATQFISRVRDTFGVEVPLRTLFEHPSVAEFAAALEVARQAAQAPQAPAVTRVSREARRMKRSDLG